MAITVPTDGAVISAGTFGKPVADEVNRMTPITTVTAWTNVTFANGWVNSGGYLTQYRKVGDIVYLRGRIVNGTMQTTCFTLPVGFRPAQNCQFPNGSADVGGNWQFGLIEILTDGTASCRAGTNLAQTVNCHFSTV